MVQNTNTHPSVTVSASICESSDIFAVEEEDEEAVERVDAKGTKFL